jgi:hypothetical protein
MPKYIGGQTPHQKFKKQIRERIKTRSPRRKSIRTRRLKTFHGIPYRITIPCIKADWFHKKASIPKHIYLIASGPNGKEAYDNIPEGGIKLGVNGTILYRTLDYVFYGPECIDQNWWYVKHKFLKTTKVVAKRNLSLEQLGSIPDYSWESIKPSGVTNAGNLILYLIDYCSVEHITLCGADMGGLDNFYEKNVRESEMTGCKKRLQKLINIAPCKIDTISKTNLDVPYAK